MIANLLFTFLVGAYVGSYTMTVLSRIKAKEKVRGGYSHCMKCRGRLGMLHIIPVFSYIYNRGKCPYCGGLVGKSTILWEVGIGLFFGLLTFLLFSKLDFWVSILAYLVAVIFHLVMRVDSGYKIKWR